MPGSTARLRTTCMSRQKCTSARVSARNAEDRHFRSLCRRHMPNRAMTSARTGFCMTLRKGRLSPTPASRTARCLSAAPRKNASGRKAPIRQPQTEGRKTNGVPTPSAHSNASYRVQANGPKFGPSAQTKRSISGKEDCEGSRHTGVRYGTNIVRWGIATLATYGKVAIVTTIIAR